MAISTFTVSQAIRHAAKRGITITPEDIRGAIELGQLSTAPLVRRGLLSIDVDAWLDARVELFKELNGGQQ